MNKLLELQLMIDPNAFLCLPLSYHNICQVYPPKVKDVGSTPKIKQLFKLLTYSQEDIEDLLSEVKDNGAGARQKKTPTPLEFVLVNSYQSKEFEKLIKEAFEFFIHEPITLLYQSKIILIGDVQDLSQIEDFSKFRYLSEDNFFDFQNLIRISFGESTIVLPDPNEDPFIRKIKTAARRRERLARKNKSKKGISLTTSLGAICCMGIGLTPLNIGEISYASVDVIMTLYQQKEKYQTDINSLMAGANPHKVHPKYWIREKSDFNEIKI